MPQKPLKASGGRVSKPGKKQQAANRHGKAPTTRKGESARASERARRLVSRTRRRRRPGSLSNSLNAPTKKQTKPTKNTGRLTIIPKDARLLAAHKDARELTKALNHKNEQSAAAKATSGGGRLAVLKKAAPPVLESKDKKHRASAAAAKAKADAEVAAERAAAAAESDDGGREATMDASD
jgi:hypothetical protein